MVEIETSADQLSYARAEIRAEIGLLNDRLNALMSSQSFLVIAYASTLSSGYGDFRSPFILILPPFLAVLGAALVLEARPSLRAALQAITEWRQREAALVNSSADFAPYTLATDDVSRAALEQRQTQGRHFAIRAPIIMLAAWLVFLLIPFGLYYWR